MGETRDRDRRAADAGTPRRRRILAALAAVAPAALAWAVTAWMARGSQVREILATHALFVVALVATYFGAWAVAVLWTRGRRRLVVFRAILVTIVLVVLLVLVDAPAYLGLIDYGSYWEKATGAWRGPARAFVADSRLGFRRPPNLEMSGRPRGDIAAAWNITVHAPREMSFTYNAKGFRSPVDYESADVVVLGDSHVEGWYVSDGETVSDRLAELTGLTVANLGQVGYGPGQELLMFELEGLALSPRAAVWFYYEGNDLYDDLTFESTLASERAGGGRRFRRVRGVPFRKTSFTVNAIAALRRLMHPVIPNGMPYTGTFRDAGGTRHRLYFHGEGTYPIGPFEERLFERNKTHFRAGHALAKDRGVDLLLVFIPMKFRIYADATEFDDGSPCRDWQPWDLPDRFAAFCREEGLRCLDVTPAMKKAADAGRLLHDPAESHWNAEAHELAASLVADRLLKDEPDSEN